MEVPIDKYTPRPVVDVHCQQVQHRTTQSLINREDRKLWLNIVGGCIEVAHCVTQTSDCKQIGLWHHRSATDPEQKEMKGTVSACLSIIPILQRVLGKARSRVVGHSWTKKDRHRLRNCKVSPLYPEMLVGFTRVSHAHTQLCINIFHHISKKWMNKHINI